MRENKDSELQKALEAGMYKQSRSRWLTALAHAWICIFVAYAISLQVVRDVIDALPAVLPLVVYVFGYGVSALYLFSAVSISVQQLKNPPKLQLTAEELRMLGLDPALVPHLKVDQNAPKSIPVSPLAWASSSKQTGMSSPMSPEREYVSPYRGSTSPGGESPFYSPTTGAASPTAYSPSAYSPAAYSPSPYRGAYDRVDESPYRRTETQASSPLHATSPTKAGAMTDPRDLERYLQAQQSLERTRLGAGVQSPDQLRGYGAVSSPSQNLPIYKTMPKPDNSAKKTDANDDIYNAIKAGELYRRLGVLNKIDSWAERMRLWLVRKPLRHTLQWMSRIEKELGRDALYQSQLSQVQMGVNVVQNQQQNLFSHDPVKVFNSFNGNPQQQRHMLEYMKLERYFGEYANSREYVVDRIRVLGRDNCLSNYKWNGGQGKDGKWSTDLPTDAQIVLHLFCCYMDEKLAATIDHKSNKPQLDAYNIFSAKHFIRQKAGKPKSYVSISQTTVNPPHFNLMVAREPSPKDAAPKDPKETPQGDHDEWVVLKGRNNLFHVLCLMVFYIYRAHRGFFRQLQLGSPEIGLLDCIPEDEDDGFDFNE